MLESKIDIGRGAVATVVVTSGTIKKGDFFVSGFLIYIFLIFSFNRTKVWVI